MRARARATSLVEAGWLGPHAPADAEGWAAEQRAEGDALAGRLWRDIGIEHIDSGRLVVGDGTVDLTDELVDRLAAVEEDPSASGRRGGSARAATGRSA
jgi:hypothetical protein